MTSVHKNTPLKERRHLQHVIRKLVSRMCEEPLQINKKRTDSPIEKLAKDLNKHFINEMI